MLPLILEEAEPSRSIKLIAQFRIPSGVPIAVGRFASGVTSVVDSAVHPF